MGPAGVAVRAMPPLTVRLPLPVMARLKALSVVRGVSPSVVVGDALNLAFDAIGPDETRTVGAVARREVARLRERFPNAE
jgi:hypothetical protein